MASITWPASLLFAVLVVCTTLLSLKGLIPVHVFFTMGGLLLGYLIPKNGGPLFSKRERNDFEEETNAFTRDEVSTRKTLADVPVAKKEK